MSEILALVGTLYLIGLKQSSHTNVSELWTTDGTGVPLLRCIMSSRRFLFLLRCLRFDDRSTRKERRKLDKLAAIREIYDAFVDNCKKNYVPGVSMTIDEMLWGFRGRCGFLQYMEGKPAKIGIKVQILADAFEFYVQNLEIYCGQQPEGPYRVSNKPADIVKRLVEPLEGSNRNITTDNWYTSPTLARDLLKEGLTCYGTMKKNKREIPPEFLPSKSRELKSTIFGFQKDMMLASYATKKNKAVIMLSTLHDQPEINAITGKPEVIMDYNTTKGGVDTVDKMAAAYSVSRITRMWPQAIFHIFLNIAGINAQVLYFASEGAEPCRRRFFLKNLAFSLLKEHLLARSKIVTLPLDIKFTLKSHLNIPDPQEEAPALMDRKRGRCKGCRNTTTTLKCDTCKSFVCKKHSTSTTICNTCSSLSDSDD